MPSFFEIGPPDSEKIFEGFLPYMGMAAILVMCIHVMSLKGASGRFFFHFRDVLNFEKCIDYIGKFLVHFREVLKFS